MVQRLTKAEGKAANPAAFRQPGKGRIGRTEEACTHLCLLILLGIQEVHAWEGQSKAGHWAIGATSNEGGSIVTVVSEDVCSRQLTSSRCTVMFARVVLTVALARCMVRSLPSGA